MTEQIKAAALKWAEAVKTRQPDNVLALYHPDAVLWGTLSPIVRHGHEAIRDYFIGFLNSEGLTCRIVDGVIRGHDNFAFYSGSYEFTWEDSGRKLRLPARFSFIYKQENNKWMIIEQHSSLFPELPLDIKKYFLD